MIPWEDFGACVGSSLLLLVLVRAFGAWDGVVTRRFYARRGLIVPKPWRKGAR